MSSINQYLANEFVHHNIISQDDAAKALDIATKTKEEFYKTVVRIKAADNEKVYSLLGSISGIPYDTFSSVNLNYDLLSKVSTAFMNEHRLVPARIENNILYAVVDDPFDILGATNLEAIYKMKVSLILITDSSMNSLLEAISNKEKRDEMIEVQKNRNMPKSFKEGVVSLEEDIDAPAVAFANTLLEEAVSVGASDIHIEPQEDTVRVRYRIDGVLKDHCEVSNSLYTALVARYKIISGLDIAERRIPQDGKITVKIKGVEYDFRISTLPILYGEKIVIRIYDVYGAVQTLKSLALNKEDEKVMLHLIRNPNGIILLTGPTGSGKTTTLYAMLRELNKPGVNIQTVEDPVENQIPGVNQLQTNVKTGLTFASALRSILRQDPNIIMVGEIRDQETAHIAVQAAITGHLVLSTIHTNDAITTVSRLIDMGVEPYLVSDSLNGAVSQRLVRVLCPKCKKAHILNHDEAKMLGLKENYVIYEPHGCSYCNNTGYKGRAAAFEIMLVGDNIKDCISRKHYSGIELRDAAKKDGFVPLKRKVADMVANGTTSIEEYSSLIVDEPDE